MSPQLELWQTEWCPASHRVRQRLTELGLTYTVHQVPVDQDARVELELATGHTTIPVLVAGSDIVAGGQPIVDYLGDHYPEPPGAVEQRVKAARAKQKELEEQCRKLAIATP